VGHAVRAGYFYSGVTDVAAIEKDTALFAAVQHVWENMAGKKLYLNGGIGSRAQGEGFGPEYELNNFNNYCETCASIANVYWCYRMFLATGESKYIDVLERTLYNGLIAGVSLSGDLFFYDNPMASLGGHNRAKWFGCACCPGNITRFMASVPLYNYATAGNSVYVNLYVQGKAKISLEKDTVELLQTTQYPWSGDVKLTVNTKRKAKFRLLLRIPGWANGKPVPTDLYYYDDDKENTVTLLENGKTRKIKIQNGYAVIEKEWNNGDEVALHFDMPVRRVAANEKAKYDTGLLAVERGPILYSMESIDQTHPYLFDMIVPKETNIEAHYDKDLLGGITVLTGKAIKNNDSVDFKAIPYSVWNNRGTGQLMVWMPAADQYILPEPKPSIASRARQIGGWGYNDGITPSSSDDINTPYQCWWFKKGTQEAVEYQFDKPETVSSVDVYWLDFEHYDVSYKTPESWKLLYKDGNKWKEVQNPSGYDTETDKYNHLTFNPVTTSGLKIAVQLKDNYSGGIIEWKVD
jgi:DUF1680 family protein